MSTSAFSTWSFAGTPRDGSLTSQFPTSCEIRACPTRSAGSGARGKPSHAKSELTDRGPRRQLIERSEDRPLWHIVHMFERARSGAQEVKKAVKPDRPVT